MIEKILVIGANGQLGTELTIALGEIHGNENIITSDLFPPKSATSFTFEKLDVMDSQRLLEVIETHGITQVYHLAAILSAKGELDPKWAWNLNMNGLLNVLELAKDKKLNKVYWPSSIAVFGPSTPMNNTPQHTVMDPNTVYGISKLAGERWCEYYFEKYGVDVRSLRYPGLIGYKSLPGGGTTDYAVDIYHKAIKGEIFECFLSKDTYLPMMYMSDAIKATIDLMEAPKESIKVRSSYNVSAMSFSPEEMVASIQKLVPSFEAVYNSDFRQDIADSWPNSIDDSVARADWGWQPELDLDKMTKTILEHLPETLASLENA